jgi:hypothetical protein
MTSYTTLASAQDVDDEMVNSDGAAGDVELVDSPGYRVSERELRVGGWTMFGVSYGLSAAGGIVTMALGGGSEAGPGTNPLGALLLVPLAGPAIMGGLHADQSVGGAIAGVLWSLIEIGGVSMAVVGSVRRARERDRARASTSARERHIALLPVGPGDAGVSLSAIY